ncbi:MAG: T9SS type A sorting domain-containing protein, partial [Phaeodactylibacter sp.]|nr:T9SS type A sorting domain-containing protein [Phaeodactylibacter sp.]
VKIFGSTSGSIIADYPFSGNANDVSGNNLHGQPNGALLTADRFGNPQSAYYFYGGPQHIAVPNSPILNFQESITASCWFSAGGLPDKETFLLSHGSWQNRWKLSITPDKLLRWTVNTLSGIADLDATVALQVDSFYHVAATYDGSLLALYINGELHSYKALSGLMRTTAVPFLMGQMLPGETNYNFKGVMDEVKLYDYALNPDAVKTLYETGTVRTEERAGAAPLVLYPNPATEMLTIALPEQAGALTGIRAYNLTGQLVLQERTYSTEPVTIEINNWKTGVYTIIGITKNGSFSSWFVKM